MLDILLVLAVIANGSKGHTKANRYEHHVGWTPYVATEDSVEWSFPYLGGSCLGSKCEEVRMFTNKPVGCKTDEENMLVGTSFSNGTPN